MSTEKIEKKLGELVRQFFAKHPDVRLIAVTGSAGKTSAKIAIATLLSKQYAIQLREEEPLSKADVFLQIMGVTMPENGPFKWHRVLKAVKKRVEAPQPEVQIIVQEFNPQHLGYNSWFNQYIIPDITVVTSVTNGRMEVEYPLEQVAEEMISLANFSRMALINRDDISGEFSKFLRNPNITTYGSNSIAEYFFEESQFSINNGHQGKIFSPEDAHGLPVTVKLLGEHNIRPAIAAVAVAYAMRVSDQNIADGVSELQSLSGRMNLLRGADGTWLIDDSYSSTPLTAISALQTLYNMETTQRIAVLGNMNGLKGIYQQAHSDLGEYCMPDLLDWVVTVGEKANKYLAPSARRRGCQVKECKDAIEAGAFVRSQLKDGGIALFKGSSGGVWLEEAVKINLHSILDAEQLVRQDKPTMNRKEIFFTQNRLK